MKPLPVGRILVDTGPLVAIFDPEDEHHDVCVQALAGLPVPLYSCWPVITEAAWLLRYSPSAIRQLLGIVETGFLALLELEGSEAKSLAALMEKYARIRPQLADVALVHLAGREGCDTIFTLDRRDFSLYRTGRGRSFRILPQL